MASHAEFMRIGRADHSPGTIELDQWNEWLEQNRCKMVFAPEERKQALATALSIVDGTHEPILRQKALLLCAELLKDSAGTLPENDLRQTVRSILADPRGNIWEQVAAVLISWRLEKPIAAAGQLAAVIDRSHAREDGFFLRANLLEHAKEESAFFHFLSPQLSKFLYDASPYVRIRALELLIVRRDYLQLLERCEEGEQDPQVQAAYLYCFAELLLGCDAEHLMRVGQAFQRVYGLTIPRAREAFLLRLNEILRKILLEGQSLSEDRHECLQNIWLIVRKDEEDNLRRHSSLTFRCLQILANSEQRLMFQELATALSDEKNSGKYLCTHRGSFQYVANSLAVLAHFGLGFEVKEQSGTFEIRSAYGSSFSLWRFVHELKTPSGHKRQGAAHWRSRHLQGTIRIPSSLTCELVATTVPGEPLFIPEAGGWRPWLPLLCDVYRMLFRFPLLQIYTADGVTIVKRPRSWLQRCKVWLQLVFRYESVARLRNWTLRHGADPGAYIKRLMELGFMIRFEPAVLGEKDSTILKFFGRES